MIRLYRSHILLEADFAQQYFANCSHVLAAYNTQSNTLLVSAVSAQWLPKLYDKVAQFVLKQKNSKGDCSIAIHQILLDYDITDVDRPLDYQWMDQTQLLKINL